MPISQVQVKIADYSNGQLVNVSDLGSQRTGPPPLVTFYDVQPPTGTGTLVLLADATPIPLTAQTQCSFTIVSATCMTACDCPAGHSCVMGTCGQAGNEVYCCPSATCPSGAVCQNPNGTFANCPMP